MIIYVRNSKFILYFQTYLFANHLPVDLMDNMRLKSVLKYFLYTRPGGARRWNMYLFQ